MKIALNFIKISFVFLGIAGSNHSFSAEWDQFTCCYFDRNQCKRYPVMNIDKDARINRAFCANYGKGCGQKPWERPVFNPAIKSTSTPKAVRQPNKLASDFYSQANNRNRYDLCLSAPN